MPRGFSDSFSFSVIANIFLFFAFIEDPGFPSYQWGEDGAWGRERVPMSQMRAVAGPV